MDSRYQALFQTYLDEQDEISAWWGNHRAPVPPGRGPFPGKVSAEYDDRVDSAYCVGYRPEERKRLVDAYMADFFGIYGRYPQTIGSWVLDSVTLGYAAERYGILGAPFAGTRWEPMASPSGVASPMESIIPAGKNEFVPAQTLEEQIPAPMFRLLGPDPIYNFEQDVREGLQGVYTLEPSWLTGRDPKWISWFFHCLCEEEPGVPYAQVGQENNFLWEKHTAWPWPTAGGSAGAGKPGGLSGRNHGGLCHLVPEPACPNPAHELPGIPRLGHRPGGLSAQWYASCWYRVGFLGRQDACGFGTCFYTGSLPFPVLLTGLWREREYL